ncbi:unnamed protein product [Boreogadus saida]
MRADRQVWRPPGCGPQHVVYVPPGVEEGWRRRGGGAVEECSGAPEENSRESSPALSVMRRKHVTVVNQRMWSSDGWGRTPVGIMAASRLSPAAGGEGPWFLSRGASWFLSCGGLVVPQSWGLVVPQFWGPVVPESWGLVVPESPGAPWFLSPGASWFLSRGGLVVPQSWGPVVPECWRPGSSSLSPVGVSFRARVRTTWFIDLESGEDLEEQGLRHWGFF